MSGAWVAVGVAAATVATSVYTNDRNRKAQHQAMDAQREESDRQLKQQQQAFNKQNQQQTNLEDIYGANQDGGMGNMITGPQGVNRNQLNLGGGSLLGG
jgi:hypothetical protein|nr:MAG TPA_asm: hypothetical protein [Caudoviricetes sp.]